MKVPQLLQHDDSNYAELFRRILEISTMWKSPQGRAQQLVPLSEIWDDLHDDSGSRALPKSFVAHLLADLQMDPQEERRLDVDSLRALTPVWVQCDDPRMFDVGCRFLPSIYLSLAIGTRKCGDQAGAREYLRRARLTLPVLPDTPYKREVISGIERAERKLRAGTVS